MKVRKICKKLKKVGYDYPSLEIFGDESGIIKYFSTEHKLQEEYFENKKEFKKLLKKMLK